MLLIGSASTWIMRVSGVVLMCVCSVSHSGILMLMFTTLVYYGNVIGFFPSINIERLLVRVYVSTCIYKDILARGCIQ